MDYLCGPNVILRVLIKERQEIRRIGGDVAMEARGWNDTKKGP